MRKRERTRKKQFKKLLKTFGQVIVEKLLANERKYKFNDGWRLNDWKEQLQRGLAEHVQKGDPRDVAIYALFAHYHGWPTAEHIDTQPRRFAEFEAMNDVLRAAQGTESYVNDLPIWRGTLADGKPATMSLCMLDAAERLEVFRTGELWIGHLGHTHNPVFIHGTHPFVYSPEPKQCQS